MLRFCSTNCQFVAAVQTYRARARWQPEGTWEPWFVSGLQHSRSCYSQNWV